MISTKRYIDWQSDLRANHSFRGVMKPLILVPFVHLLGYVLSSQFNKNLADTKISP